MRGVSVDMKNLSMAILYGNVQVTKTLADMDIIQNAIVKSIAPNPSPHLSEVRDE